MNKSMKLYAFLIAIFFFVASPVGAVQAEKRCFSCEAVQHAVNLNAIEKHLQQSDPRTVKELSEEAREWFAKFQEGGMFFDGWKDISNDVVSKVPDEKRISIKIAMLALGIRIGCEWSKDNNIRKISTEMLQEWGGQLRDTVEKRPEKIPHVIQNIESEVDTLLTSQS